MVNTMVGLAARIVGLAGVLLALHVEAQTPAGPAAASSRVPTVVLGRDVILAGQSVPVLIYFSEAPGAPAPEQVCVRLFGPTFLKVELPGPAAPAAASGACKVWPEALPLGPFSDGRPVLLSLHATGVVDEGKATLLFSVAYSEAGPHIANIEKTVNVGVLGIGSVAGVPLQFAILIFPGLVALGFARAAGVEWVGRLVTSEAGALAVLMSLVLLSGVGLLSGIFGIASGLGTSTGTMLLTLVGGLLAGVVFWFVSFVARQQEARAAAEAVIGPNDEFAAAVVKAIRINAANLRPDMVSSVTTTDGRNYVGSLWAPAPGGGIAILGWGNFQTGNEQVAKNAQRALERKDWSGLADAVAQGIAEPGGLPGEIAATERVRVFDAKGDPLQGEQSAIVRLAAEAGATPSQRKRKEPEQFGGVPICAVELIKGQRGSVEHTTKPVPDISPTQVS